MGTPCEQITDQMGMLFMCSQVNEYTRIQTPFLYPDGDIIDIFYREDGDIATLTDLGETMRWLRMQTVAQRKSRKQRQLIQDIVLTHNLEFFRGMLMVRVRQSEDLANAITRLSQGMLRVSDLWFTFRNKLGESIVDDVEDLLQESKIAFDRSPQVPGRSTAIWRPDFQTRYRDRSTLIHVLSTGSHAVAHDQAIRATAMWHDLSYLKVGREALRFISLFDDTVDVWNPEDFGLVEDLSDLAYWSRADEFLGRIA